MAELSSAIHGHSFQVEDSTLVDRASATGAGLAISGYRGGASRPPPAVWVHAAIPTVAIWRLLQIPFPPGSTGGVELDFAVTLSQVHVEFDAAGSDEFHLANLHVWDGGNRLLALDNLQERGPGFTHTFDPALGLSVYAVGLSFGLELPLITGTPTPRPPRPPTFVFHLAKANFTVEGL
jgi:hypothetical protein